MLGAGWHGWKKSLLRVCPFKKHFGLCGLYKLIGPSPLCWMDQANLLDRPSHAMRFCTKSIEAWFKSTGWRNGSCTWWAPREKQVCLWVFWCTFVLHCSIAKKVASSGAHAAHAAEEPLRQRPFVIPVIPASWIPASGSSNFRYTVSKATSFAFEAGLRGSR